MIHLISVAESLADLEPTKARLLKNPKDIADVFRKYYGNNIASTIEKLLTELLVVLILFIQEKLFEECFMTI